jgi:PAS domain S-box-containing protein
MLITILIHNLHKYINRADIVIKELRKAEATVKAQREQLRITLVSIGDGVIATDINGCVMLINPEAQRLTGWKEEEAIGQTISSIFEIINEHSRKKVENPVEKVLVEGKTVEMANHTVLISKEGKHTHISDSGAPILDDLSNVSGVVLVFRDVTAARQAECEREQILEQLQAEHILLETLIEQLPIGVFITEVPSGKILRWNPAMEHHWQYDVKLHNELFDYQNIQIFHKDGKQYFPEEWPLARAISGREIIKDEMVRFHPDQKTWRTLLLSAAPIHNSQGEKTAIVNTVRDVSDLLSLEEQLRQTQKMEAIGRLAGGVAHDFNNILTIILSYTELLEIELKEQEQDIDIITEIQKAAKKAASLTSQLLSFSRRQVIKAEVLDMNPVISNMNNMLQRIIGEDIALEYELQPNLGKVLADAGQIEQVILNMAVNARDAMPGGGTFRLKTTNITLDTAYADEHYEVNPGAYALIEISDTGIGMDHETQSHIFEPFFTTKESSKGTGLGLSIVYGIVQQSNGHILVYSEKGVGTVFKIYLPLVGDSVKQAVSLKPIERGDSKGSETILLVEDEQLIRKLASKVLKENGYTVLEAQNGFEALEVSESFSNTIHLLISDMVMPKMGGWSLSRELMKKNSDLKILLMSGYSSESIPNLNLAEELNFLQKPFTAIEFISKVRMVLDNKLN